MGGAALALYRTLTSAVSPLLLLHLFWRRHLGLELPHQLPQRLGRSSVCRPPGPLLWFHAVSVGEAMAAIPVIKHCMLKRPSLNILLTTSTVASYVVLQKILPSGVLCQFAPIDTPAAVERFLTHWHPEAGIFLESELWPNLLITASLKGTVLALLNARMSARSFERWLSPAARHLVMELLSRFSLILPLSTEEAIRYQILGAPPTVVHFVGNLKYAVGAAHDSGIVDAQVSFLKAELNSRRVWIAASTHLGEEDGYCSSSPNHANSRIHPPFFTFPFCCFSCLFNIVFCFLNDIAVAASIHMELKKILPELITIIAPRHPERGHTIALKLRERGLQVAMRSHGDDISVKTDVYVGDTIGELKVLYEVSEVAFIGGSLFKGMAGHNLAEAAAANCAVATGPYIGHFQQMISDFHRISTLSVRQVSGVEELQQHLQVLFTDPRSLEACKDAARNASEVCARDVVRRVWRCLEQFVLGKAFDNAANHSQENIHISSL